MRRTDAATAGAGPARAARGFTLVETLAAFTILALVLATVHGAFSTGLGSAGRASRTAFAVDAARSLLAEVGVTQSLEPGESRVTLEDGWEGRIIVAPLRAATAAGVSAFAISVDVTERGTGAAVARLETVRLAGVDREDEP